MATTYERVDIVSIGNGIRDEFNKLKQEHDKILGESEKTTKEERK